VIVGVGIDIVDIARIRALHQRYGMRFVQRIFSANEIAYCMKRYDPAVCFAGRFAVKEAAYKALSAGESSGIPFKDISIDMEGRAPRLRLVGKALDHLRSIGAGKCHVSISHDKGCAVAVVILESA
jgi:holo-[acyl-carrier protein] synthase